MKLKRKIEKRKVKFKEKIMKWNVNYNKKKGRFFFIEIYIRFRIFWMLTDDNNTGKKQIERKKEIIINTFSTVGIYRRNNAF